MFAFRDSREASERLLSGTARKKENRAKRNASNWQRLLVSFFLRSLARNDSPRGSGYDWRGFLGHEQRRRTQSSSTMIHARSVLMRASALFFAAMDCFVASSISLSVWMLVLCMWFAKILADFEINNLAAALVMRKNLVGITPQSSRVDIRDAVRPGLTPS